MFNIFVFILLATIINADDVVKGQSQRVKGATLKPISACCDIPELGEEKPLSECSVTKLSGPCNDVQCVFEKSGFLIDQSTLNKESYRSYLLAWAKKHEGWSVAIDKAIKDCIDKELRQHLDYPCRAYDAFTCTSIAMLKKCPDAAWKC